MDNKGDILDTIIDLIEDSIITGDDTGTISKIVQLLKDNGLIGN